MAASARAAHAMFAHGSMVAKLKMSEGGTKTSGRRVFMESQMTSVKLRNQIRCPFAHLNAGIVQASSRASLQYHA